MFQNKSSLTNLLQSFLPLNESSEVTEISSSAHDDDSDDESNVDDDNDDGFDYDDMFISSSSSSYSSSSPSKVSEDPSTPSISTTDMQENCGMGCFNYLRTDTDPNTSTSPKENNKNCNIITNRSDDHCGSSEYCNYWKKQYKDKTDMGKTSSSSVNISVAISNTEYTQSKANVNSAISANKNGNSNPTPVVVDHLSTKRCSSISNSKQTHQHQHQHRHQKQQRDRLKHVHTSLEKSAIISSSNHYNDIIDCSSDSSDFSTPTSSPIKMGPRSSLEIENPNHKDEYKFYQPQPPPIVQRNSQDWTELLSSTHEIFQSSTPTSKLQFKLPSALSSHHDEEGKCSNYKVDVDDYDDNSVDDITVKISNLSLSYSSSRSIEETKAATATSITNAVSLSKSAVTTTTPTFMEQFLNELDVISIPSPKNTSASASASSFSTEVKQKRSILNLFTKTFMTSSSRTIDTTAAINNDNDTRIPAKHSKQTRNDKNTRQTSDIGRSGGLCDVAVQHSTSNSDNNTKSYNNNSKNVMSQDRFVDIWLKEVTMDDQILLQNDQENILLGTPVKIVGNAKTNHTDPTRTNNSTPFNKKAKSISPIRKKRLMRRNPFHNSTAAANAASATNSTTTNNHIPLRKVNSDFSNTSNISSSLHKTSPTRKIANMIPKIKIQKQNRRLSIQSTKILSSITQHDEGTTVPYMHQMKKFDNGRSLILNDDAIRGKLDGIDVLSLGSARYVSYIGSKSKSLAGQRYTLRSMVSDTLWSSSGREMPEIVLEGFDHTGNDRWTVLIEDDTAASVDDCTSSTTRQRMKQRNLDCEIDDSSMRGYGDEGIEVTVVPTHLLLSQIWGNDEAPPPTHDVKFEKSRSSLCGGEHDNNGGLRAVSSCPIDTEKNIFLIKNEDHIQSVHNIAVVPLKYGQFDESICVFKKILRSLKHSKRFKNHHHLLRACYHNLGILHMWNGRYEEALTQFNKAISVRIKATTFLHPSVAVSLSKVGLASFALEQLDNALKAFEKALEIRRKVLHFNNMEVAKLLNNIAAVHYQKGEKKVALRKYNEALAIMNALIQGPVRRESLVYETSVILSNMGKIYIERKKYQKAYVMFENALMIQISTFKRSHDCILTTLGSIAFLYVKGGEISKALMLYTSLFAMQIEKFGPMTFEAIETQGLMSMLYIQLGRYQEAQSCLKEVLKWQKLNLDKHHPALTNTNNTIKKLRRAIKGARDAFANV